MLCVSDVDPVTVVGDGRDTRFHQEGVARLQHLHQAIVWTWYVDLLFDMKEQVTSVASSPRATRVVDLACGRSTPGLERTAGTGTQQSVHAGLGFVDKSIDDTGR